MTKPREPRAAVRNAGDAQQVQKAQESDRARLERERNENFAVWNTYEGRSFTRRLLAHAGVYRLSMVNESHWTAFNEGARNIGLTLLAEMIESAPELYALMEQEHIARDRREPSAPVQTATISDDHPDAGH